MAYDLDYVPRIEGASTVVFIDDYPESYDDDEKREVSARIEREAGRLGLELDGVGFESDCAAAADSLAVHLRHADYWLEATGNGSRRAIAIRVDDCWTCPALAAIWTLARLGYDPYWQIVCPTIPAADETLTVLPTKYLDVEASVVEILRQLRIPRVPLSRVKYVFT